MKKKLKRKLRKAMALPFDQALPIIRKATCKDYRIAFEPDVAAWCVRHVTEIQALVNSRQL